MTVTDPQPLYNLINRKNKSTVYKSAFVHPSESIVSVENNGNDRYQELHLNRSGFEEASAMILREVGRHYDDIEQGDRGYIEVTFYSTYHGGHITRGVHKNDDGEIIIV